MPIIRPSKPGCVADLNNNGFPVVVAVTMAKRPPASSLQSPTRRELAARTTPAPAAGRVYGYARVSTARQADEGESLDVQQRQIDGYAHMQGTTLDKVFVERGVSGSKPLSDRPQGAALLAALKAGDVVIIAKLDRMFRSALDALDVLGRLKESGVNLHMIDLGGDVTGNGVSKLVFTILSAVAEAERDRTRERVAEVKRDQRQRGRYLGGKVPWGWKVGDAGDLLPEPTKRTALKQMRKMRAEGASLRAISDKMKAAGLSVTHQGVKNALAAANRLASG
jgi:putative DNA-invertase from lambdoid prophage Rac